MAVNSTRLRRKTPNHLLLQRARIPLRKGWECVKADDGSNVKVYDQKRPVEYADYMPGMLYVSVYEVFPTKATK